MKKPSNGNKWFLCREPGGCLPDEDFVIQAPDLNEARSDAVLYYGGAVVLRELANEEVV